MTKRGVRPPARRIESDQIGRGPIREGSIESNQIGRGPIREGSIESNQIGRRDRLSNKGQGALSEENQEYLEKEKEN